MSRCEHSGLVFLLRRDLEDTNARPLQRLSTAERRLLACYRPIGLNTQDFGGSVKASWPYRLTGTPPMVLLGGYVMNNSYVPPGSMGPPKMANAANPPSLTFAEAQKQLQAGYGRRYIDYVYGIEAATNVLTALVCHADGGRPRTVCTRPVIKRIRTSFR